MGVFLFNRAWKCLETQNILETVGEAGMNIYFKDCNLLHNFLEAIQFYQVLNAHILDQGISLLIIVSPNYTSICVQGRLYEDINMALFTIAKGQKQSKCPFNRGLVQ